MHKLKKVLYICRVNIKTKQMKTTIKTTDFSSKTLEMFNEAKKTNSFLLTWDLVRILIDNDFPPKDVKAFVKSNFRNDLYKHLDYSI